MIRDKSNYLKILLSVFFVVCVILPLIQVLANIDGDSWRELCQQPKFGESIRHSLTAAGLSTLVSVGLALLLSFCLARSNIRLKNMFKIVLTLPMLIPSISHGWGLKMLLGNNGILTKWLGMSEGIYGLTGIVMGSVMYSFPIAFLMLADVLSYEDSSPYEAADVLGISKVRQFGSITLPYLSKALISVVFSVFTMVVTDYGVPIAIGGTYNTLPVSLLKEFDLNSQSGKLSIYGAILLLPAVAAFVIDLLKKEQSRSAFVNKAIKPRKNALRDVLCYGVCITMCAVVIFPIAAFALMSIMQNYPYDMSFTLDHIVKTIDQGGDTFLINSLIVSALVSVVGTAIAYLCAYCTARTNGVFSRALHLMSITSMAIPGLVLGLSYTIFFSDSALYGTLAILVFVNTIHFFASPYLMIYNSFNIINKSLEDVGATLNISRPRILLDVLVPQTRDTLVEMLSYFFVNSMMTISAVSFLANSETRQLALMINTFEASSLMGCAAFVSLVILIVNMFLKTTFYILKKSLKKSKAVKPAV
ncbi:MAG: ABC transporter permease subunit [Clostridia bacterium]|nr:ABC transporter permease subunit [Clostridia bacterium]